MLTVDTITSPLVTLGSTFSLIGLAEIGDKSQLVCMTLAACYRPWPVLLGAVCAFILLNLAAVLFGAAAAHWLPDQLVVLLVGLLFLLFGIHALRNSAEDEGEAEKVEKGNHGIFLSTFLLIVFAEFGDKTQIAVAALASTANVYAVWLGATLALAVTSGLGVWVGRTILQRIPLRLLHRLSGGLFVLLGLVAWLSLIL